MPSCSARIASAVARVELDAYDGLEVGARGEPPAHVDRGPGPAAGRPEPLDDRRVGQLRVAAPEPRPERRPGRVVVDDQGHAAATYDPVELGQPGLAARPEEVGPARVHDVDGRVGQRQRLRGARVHGDVRQGPGTPPGERDQVGMRLHARDRRGGLGEPRQVEAGPAADVEDVAAGPVDHARASPTRAGRRGRRRGSRPRRSRCGARCWGSGECPREQVSDRQGLRSGRGRAASAPARR